MNIVLDTNMVISGIFWKGAPRQVLDLARSGVHTLFTSPDLLEELGDVLSREKFAQRLAMAETSVEELVFGYAALAKTVRPIAFAPVVKNDPDDDKVLACARAANVEAIVSGDTHLLSLGEYEGITIFTVNQFLARHIK